MMNSEQLFPLFLLGIMGTGHCIGMCGPLVIAFPGRSPGWKAHGFYHLGRLAVYAMIGMLLGGLGGAASRGGEDSIARLAGFQVTFSLAAGIFLLVFGLSRMGMIKEPLWMSQAVPQRIPGASRLLKEAFQKPESFAMIGVGGVMGFLPCGLSFAAFARALAAGGMAPGGLMTLVFGLGTLPGLLAVGTGAGKILRRHQKTAEILAGLLMIWMGVDLGLDALLALWSLL